MLPCAAPVSWRVNVARPNSCVVRDSAIEELAGHVILRVGGVEAAVVDVQPARDARIRGHRPDQHLPLRPIAGRCRSRESRPPCTGRADPVALLDPDREVRPRARAARARRQSRGSRCCGAGWPTTRASGSGSMLVVTRLPAAEQRRARPDVVLAGGEGRRRDRAWGRSSPGTRPARSAPRSPGPSRAAAGSWRRSRNDPSFDLRVRVEPPVAHARPVGDQLHRGDDA